MADLIIGQNLGGCIVLEELGTGGMASVYRARREDDGEIVAVKVLSKKLTVSPDFIKRFEREAVLMKSFDHPHILPVYDFAREEACTYIIMKLLEGGSLNAYAQEKRLTVDEIVRILTEIASALDYAHSKNVIHRDLKPANVLMDVDGNTFLSDFGIAKFKEESIGLTASGMMIGTPGYMAPEQWRSEPVDARTDVYAFGVMVFELFSGRLPFNADTPFALMYRHLDEPPPPVSRARGDLPRTLDRVLRRALAKVPEHRYPSAGAVVTAIQEALKEAEELSTQQFPQDTSFIIDQTITPVDLKTPPLVDGKTFITRDGQPTPAAPDDRTFAANITPSDWQARTLDDVIELEYASYNAVDVGGRTLLERAKEAVQELSGENAGLAQSIVHYVQDLRERAKRKPGEDQGPYRALESYDLADHKLFFGREVAIEAMLARSPHARFTVLHAESGAGKTSLLRAGLMPRLLAGGFLPLYVAVRRQLPHEAIKSVLLSDPAQAPELAKSSLRTYLKAVSQTVGMNREIFIFIDQFETFFTDVFTDEQRAEFISEIAECLDDELLPVRITLAMRTEYFGLLASFQPHIAQPFAHEFLLRALVEQEAQRALILPARAQGYDYEESVAAQILQDLANASHEIAPPQLQLVGGAMIETLPPDRKTITLDDYMRAGQAEGVLRGYLERMLNRFPVEERRLARLVIEGLVRADQTRDVRTRSSLQAEFEAQGIATDHLDSVLHSLRENRVLRLVELENELAYELVHDYLALQVQLDPETTALKAAQELLDRRVGDFERYGSLLTEQELGIINAQAERLHLTDIARHLIDQTRAIRRRQRRRAIGLVTAAIVGVFAALGLGLLAAIRENQNRQERLEAAQTSEAIIAGERDRANLAAQISESGRVALRGLLMLDENRVDTALLLAVEANTIFNTQEARSSLLTALENIPQLSRFLYGHDAQVRSVAYSPDGTLFASAGADGKIVFWDAQTNEPLAPAITGLSGNVWTIAFSPDGQVLATAGEDGIIRLWDIETRQQNKAMGSFAEVIYSLAFSPDGQWLAAGYEDGTVRLWNVAGGTLRQELVGHTDTVYSLKFSLDGQMLASASADTTIILWNLSQPDNVTPLGTLAGHTNWVLSLDFSPDGAHLVSGSADNSLLIWDLASRTPVGQPITDHTNWVRSVVYSPDGQLIATASHDRTIILRNAATGQRLGDVAPLVGHAQRIDSVAFSPDSHWLISGGQDGYVLVWDVTERQPLSRILGGHQIRVNSVAFSPDGTKLASASRDSTVLVWDTATGTIIREPLAAQGEILAVAFSPDGQQIAYAGIDGRVYVWELTDAEPRRVLLHNTNGLPVTIHSIAFSPDGRFIAAGGEDQLISVWELTSGQLVGTVLAGHTGPVMSVAFSPDSKTLASGSNDRTIILWDVSNSTLLQRFSTQHTRGINTIAFSHDGQYLVSGSSDRTLILWDVKTGEPAAAPLTGHIQGISSVAFSPDDTMIASGGQDDTIILWDVASRQAIGQPLKGHSEIVMSVVFSPDGKTLASSSIDTTVRLWEVSLEAWQARACRVVNRNLSTTEWERFLPGVAYRNTCNR